MDKPRNNPYEILLFAAPFLLAGIMLLLKSGPAAILAHGSTTKGQSTMRYGTYSDAINPSMVHTIGVIALVIGCGLVWFYFYIYRQIRMDEA